MTRPTVTQPARTTPATEAYGARLKALSDRLVQIQKPIQILDAIKWPSQWRDDFFARGETVLPPATREYYQGRAFAYKAEKKRADLKELREVIVHDLGKHDALGKILLQTVDQYLLVLDLLEARGTPGFKQLSKQLYGSAHDRFRGDNRTMREMADKLCAIFSQPAAKHLTASFPKRYNADEAVQLLQEKLASYFPLGEIKVLKTDGIVSDAAAGGDSIKINTNAMFSERDLKILEVHEGWVHVGTTLNGRRQRYATWLSVGSPRIAAIQEGLAVLMETLTFSTYPFRAQRISDRAHAIYLAEEGANFIEVYHAMRARDMDRDDAWTITQRVFRGGMVEGGAPFTKDLSYVLGFVENVNFLRCTITAGIPELIPMLFVGKVTLEDIPALYQGYLDGLIDAPHFMPAMFRDLSGLYVWFGFSSGIGLVDIKRVQEHYLESFAPLIRPAHG